MLSFPSFATLVHRSWDVYSRYFRTFMLSVLAIGVPLNIAYAFIVAFYPENLLLVGGVVGASVLGGLLYTVLFSFFIREIWQKGRRRKAVDWKRIMRETFQAYPRSVAVVVVMVGALGVLLLLLVVPALVFSFYWIFVVYSVIFRRAGVFGSFQYSFQLVRGRWWKVVWTVVRMWALVLSAGFLIATFSLTILSALFSVFSLTLDLGHYLVVALFLSIEEVVFTFGIVFMVLFFFSLESKQEAT